jgi:hypothetical protein
MVSFFSRGLIAGLPWAPITPFFSLALGLELALEEAEVSTLGELVGEGMPRALWAKCMCSWGLISTGHLLMAAHLAATCL